MRHEFSDSDILAAKRALSFAKAALSECDSHGWSMAAIQLSSAVERLTRLIDGHEWSGDQPSVVAFKKTASRDFFISSYDFDEPQA